jgi:dynein light intermediate chain 2
MPLPTLIVGTKYDLFRNNEPEQKKWVLRFLRYVAHTNGCSLAYSSHKHPLGQEGRAFIGSLLAGEPSAKCQADYQQPFIIGAGADELGRMELPRSEAKSASLIEVLKKTVVERLGKAAEEPEEQGLVDWDKYKEPRIDQAITEMLSGSRRRT